MAHTRQEKIRESMKLIDKDDLLAKINNRIIDAPIDCYGHQRVWAYNDVKEIIDTIEVKEVDFKGIKSVFEGQYLSKDKVVTTIEMLQDECEEQGDNNGTELLEKLFNKLGSLEVKEVDLDKEIDRELETRWRGEYLYTKKFRESAKHFFELGLKAQKGE